MVRVSERGGSVVSFVLVVPVAECIVVGVRQGDLIDSLVHLDVLVSVGSDGSQVVHLGEVYVGCTYHVLGFLRQFPYGVFLELGGEPSAASKLCELECVLALVESFDLGV